LSRSPLFFFFFFNDTATTEIYTLSLHDALPILARRAAYACDVTYCTNKEVVFDYLKDRILLGRQPGRIQLQLERLCGERARVRRSEEHTSELQSLAYLVCRLLLEKKKKTTAQRI